jgi:hypothetical protein
MRFCLSLGAIVSMCLRLTSEDKTYPSDILDYWVKLAGFEVRVQLMEIDDFVGVEGNVDVWAVA